MVNVVIVLGIMTVNVNGSFTHLNGRCEWIIVRDIMTININVIHTSQWSNMMDNNVDRNVVVMVVATSTRM